MTTGPSAPPAEPAPSNQVRAPAGPPGYPPIGAAVAQRARAITTPPAWKPPSGDAFALSIYEQERREKKSRDLLFGGLLLVVGVLVTALTYDSASRAGGTYLIAWGPMVFGAIRLFKGLTA